MTEEKRWTGKKTTKKKSGTGKYFCPACKEHFTTRKEAYKHQFEKNHSGAIGVIDKDVKKKKSTNKKTSGKSAPKKSKKREKMNKAGTLFQKKIDYRLLKKE